MGMTWYVAHILLLIRFKDGNQDSYPLWENMVLLRANNPTDAEVKAKEFADTNYLADYLLEGYEVNDRPAYLEYRGLRKLITADLPENLAFDPVEVTFQEIEVADEDALKKLCNGETVNIVLD